MLGGVTSTRNAAALRTWTESDRKSAADTQANSLDNQHRGLAENSDQSSSQDQSFQNPKSRLLQQGPILSGPGADSFRNSEFFVSNTSDSLTVNTDTETATIQSLNDSISLNASQDPTGFRTALDQAFDGKADAAALDNMAQNAANGDLPLPENVRFVDTGSLGPNALGAYDSANGGTIYLDRNLLNDADALQSVYTEELGHHLDATLGGVDAAGDEGAIFATSLLEGPIGTEKLQSLKSENDSGFISIDGKQVEVEFYQYTGPGSSVGTGGLATTRTASTASTPVYTGPGSSVSTGGLPRTSTETSSTVVTETPVTNSSSGNATVPNPAPATETRSTTTDAPPITPVYTGPGSSIATGGLTDPAPHNNPQPTVNDISLAQQVIEAEDRLLVLDERSQEQLINPATGNTFTDAQIVQGQLNALDREKTVLETQMASAVHPGHIEQLSRDLKVVNDQVAALTGPQDTSSTESLEQTMEQTVEVIDENANPERMREIDQWVDDKANATSFWDDNGGENVGAALNGDSDLGPLTTVEQQYLANQSVEAWQSRQSSETIREATEAVQGNPAARRALANAMSTPAADEAQHFEDGGAYYDRPGALAFRHEMLEHAVSLDATTVIQNFDGAESSLGDWAMTEMSSANQTLLLESVAAGRVDQSAADRLTTSMFFHAEPSDIRSGEMADAMAGALARVSHPDLPGGNTATRSNMEARLTEVFEQSGGRDLLFGEEIHPEQRAWALEQVSTNPAWTSEALQDGWESDIATTAYAEEVQAGYASRGTEPYILGGEALRNTIGQAIGMEPTALPSDTETAAQQATRLGDGLNHRYYEVNERIDTIAARIEEYGGPNAQVSVVPVTVNMEDHGASVHNVFRVEGQDGSVHFVDDQGLKYDSLADWENESRLPKGVMTYPEGLIPGADLVTPRNTPDVVDTFWQHAGRVGDAVALGVGVVAGAALVIGTGGTAAIVAAGAAGGYAATRAGAELHDDHQRGIDITDLSNPQVRSNWIDVAAGTFSVAAIGGGLRLANASRQGVRVSTTAARSVAATQLIAEGLDVAAMGNQIHNLATNWDQMSNGQRAAGMLEVAFWGGMGVASARSGGAQWQDGLNFRVLEGNLRNMPTSPSEYSRNVARVLIEEASRVEPPITLLLEGQASAIGGRMEGLEFRIKSEDSLARKVTTETENKPGQPLDVSGELMNDVLRYTMILEEGNYSSGAQSSLDQLRNEGFEIGRINNAWTNETGYRGLNVTVLTPDGHQFELQFHTESSFNAKEHLTHNLYEEKRLLEESDPRIDEIDSEMNAIFDTVPKPQGVSDIE